MNQSVALNRLRYRAYAPVYDWLARPWAHGRERAIDRLALDPSDRVLIVGCGTGSDLPYLPAGTAVTAVDVTPAMVRRTATRGGGSDVDLETRVADARDLPFDDDRFDAVLLHLILSVVPNPDAVVAEAARVLVDDGRVSIFDKFVPDGSTPSLLRRAVNPLARVLFADITRQLGPMLAGTPLVAGPRESFLGGLYTVTVARSVGEPRRVPYAADHSVSTPGVSSRV